jgi:predicted DNA-binding protein (UPF0251 family)
MVKTKKCRLVSALPGITYFKPAGIPLRFLEEVQLSVEEAEALRLKDLEGLEQAQGAVRMGVSRPTFQRILSSARKKISDALLNGKAVRIEGGNFRLTGARLNCRRGHSWVTELDAPADALLCPVCGNSPLPASEGVPLPAGRCQRLEP